MAARLTIVGLGEALFDIFPDRQILGGAPLNATVHAHQLVAPRDGRGVIVTRIGQDDLGEELERELRKRGVDCGYLQWDPDKDTGRVYVGFDAHDQPEYEIVEDVAWDWLNFEADIEDLAKRCDAICFGTLAQRNAQARNAIYRMLDASPRSLKLFDVNLRQRFYDRQIVHRSCELASAVKLNEDEIRVVGDLLGLPRGDAEADADTQAEGRAMALLRTYDLKFVALTRGARGTVLLTAKERAEGEPARYEPAEGADPVGAGDGCTAAIMVGMSLRWPLQRVADLANRVGAYVASQPGATPQLPAEIVDAVS